MENLFRYKNTNQYRQLSSDWYQSTGQLDSNGRLVYVGDWCLINDKHVRIVSSNGDIGCGDVNSWKLPNHGGTIGKIEVIGNVSETPEMEMVKKYQQYSFVG